MRENDTLKRARGHARELKGDLFAADGAPLGTSQVAVHGDPCLGTASLRHRICLDKDRTHRMLPCNATDDLSVSLERTGFLVIDGQIDKGGAGLGIAALLPEFAKFFFDGANRHRDAGSEAHILLQVTP